MPPNPPSNSRLPRLAVWSGYGTDQVKHDNRNEIQSLTYFFNYLLNVSEYRPWVLRALDNFGHFSKISED